MPAHQNRWDLVAAALLRRYEQLPTNQAEVVRRSGLSDTKVREFERGQVEGTPRDVTLHKLEDAVEWPRGTIRRILAGEATEGPVVATAPGTGDEERVAALEAANEALADQLAVVAERLARLEKRLGPKRPRASNSQ